MIKNIEVSFTKLLLSIVGDRKRENFQIVDNVSHKTKPYVKNIFLPERKNITSQKQPFRALKNFGSVTRG